MRPMQSGSWCATQRAVNLRPSLVLLGTAALTFGGAFALSQLPHAAPHSPERAQTEPPEEEASALPIPSEVSALIVGGGPSPESNQLSLEEDVRLASATFGDSNSVRLFAGGSAPIAAFGSPSRSAPCAAGYRAPQRPRAIGGTVVARICGERVRFQYLPCTG